MVLNNLKMRYIMGGTGGVLASAALTLALTANAWSQGPPAGQSPRDTIAAVVIQPWGFEPSVINVKPGRLQLAFYNRSGYREALLRLAKTPGPVLKELRTDKFSIRLRDTTEFGVGQYVITEATHPQWKFQINVAP